MPDVSDAVVVALCAVAGILVAPFLTSLIAAVPDKGPVSWPRPRDHPPILFWLRSSPDRDGAVLVRSCGLTVELLAPVLFALAGVRFGASAVVVPFCVLFAALLVVSVIDIEHYRIPDRIVFPALALSLPLIVVVSLGLGLPETIGYALIGAGAYFLLLFVAHLVYPAGMGFGDVKLALVMGLFLGWIAPDPIRAVTLVLFALMIGCVLGVVVGGVLALVRRKNAAFPFGPALAASTVLAVLFSNQILGLD